MRLWHQDLIPHLPNHQLLGQHRECCALRGKGWKRKHSTVNYVFNHPITWLYAYHMLIIWEMNRRGYNHDKLWESVTYRGQNCYPLRPDKGLYKEAMSKLESFDKIYPEHDRAYLEECLQNLNKKGIKINMSRRNLM